MSGSASIADEVECLGRSIQDRVMLSVAADLFHKASAASADYAMRALDRKTAASLLMALYRSDAPSVNLRAALDRLWRYDTRCIWAEAKSSDVIISMFRKASFPVPAVLPDKITVWRGVRGVKLQAGRQGLSWTLDRGLACYYAMQHLKTHFGLKGAPLLIRREITKRDIVYLCDSEGPLDKNEVVFDAALAGEVDGTLHEWAAVAASTRIRLAAEFRAFVRPGA